MNNCWKILLTNARNAMKYVHIGGSFNEDLRESLGAAIAECEADLKNRQTEICGFCATERVAAPTEPNAQVADPLRSIVNNFFCFYEAEMKGSDKNRRI
jgi:hypothetical protein